VLPAGRIVVVTVISIPVADGTTLPAYLARPRAGSSRDTGVIVAHELFGVNPDIRGVADDLAQSGYLTIAPEFYHRDAAPGRWLERDDAGRREGFGYLHRLGRDQALADVAAGLRWLRSEPGIDRVAMVGFSAGGHLAYLAACRLPVSRTAVLYGGWLPSTDIPLSRPSPTLDLTPRISGRLLYLVGEDDSLIDAGQRGRIRDALQTAGTDHELVSYPGTGHAFFWPDTPAYRKEARDDAWARILALLASLGADDERGRSRLSASVEVNPRHGQLFGSEIAFGAGVLIDEFGQVILLDLKNKLSITMAGNACPMLLR
jgi:carboxymethylenebutenolidase